eukprot:1469146-Pleurochrysis_carterae.AAC.4
MESAMQLKELDVGECAKQPPHVQAWMRRARLDQGDRSVLDQAWVERSRPCAEDTPACTLPYAPTRSPCSRP